MKTTFYVIRSKDLGGLFHIKEGRDVGNFTSIASTANEAAQYPTACAAMARWNTNTFQKCNYEIVRVDRVTTPGTAKRRIVQDGGLLPVGAKWALMNPYSEKTDDSPSFVDAGGTHVYNNLSTTPLFDKDTALTAFLRKLPPNVTSLGSQIVRVVEETTQETVSDTLTVLA